MIGKIFFGILAVLFGIIFIAGIGALEAMFFLAMDKQERDNNNENTNENGTL